MPVKNHRPGLVRTHSRSSSGGSRAALNLQITQKDPIQPKTEKGAKRPGHAYEVRAPACPICPSTPPRS